MKESASSKPSEALTHKKSPEFQQVEYFIPADEVSHMVDAVRRTVVAYSGPLPHADELKKYNEAIENGSERVFAMLERSQIAEIEHQRRSDRSELIGLLTGSAILVGIIALGAYIVMHADNGWQGGFALALIAAPVMKVLLEQLRK